MRPTDLIRRLNSLAFVAVQIWWTSSLIAEGLPPAGNVRFVSTTFVSEHFHREAATATQSIPEHVWETLEYAGWRVQLAEFVIDAVPSLRGVQPRGWPNNLTWDNSDAIHLPTAKLLVVAEKRRNRLGEVVASSRVAGVLRHELGHAYDMAAGRKNLFLSSTPEFIAAYQRDVHRLPSEQRERFAYYLQTSRAGQQEAFAEAFGVALGGGSSEFPVEQFEAGFPSVMEYVREVIRVPIPRPSSASVRTAAMSSRASRAPLRRR